MPNPHVASMTMFFKYYEDGWSEKHYYCGASQPADLYAFKLIADPIIVLRSLMLGWGPILYRTRLSFEDTWRDSLYGAVPVLNPATTASGGQPFYGPTPGTAGVAGDPWDIARFRLECGPLYRGEEDIAGYPQGLLSPLTTFPFPGFTSYTNATNAYFNALTGAAGAGLQAATPGPWGMLVRSREQADAAITPILSVAYFAGPPVGWTFALQANAPFTSGYPVRILGITQNPGTPRSRINGTWNALNVAGATFQVAFPGASALTQPLVAGATCQAIVIKPKPYTAWQFDGTSHRKRGVPSDRPRGRSPRRARTAVV